MATEDAGYPGPACQARQALAARGPCTSAAQRPDTAEQWLQFAVKQQARVAPHPAPGALVGTTSSAPFRLSLSHLEGLPLFQAEDCNLEVRLGVTLFETAAGCFLGNTCYTPPVAYDMRKSKGKKGFHVDLGGADLYFHSKAPLAGELAAVVEVVLAQRSAEGVVEGEYSAGWAQVPLQLLRGQSYGLASAPSSPVRSPSKRGGGGASFASPQRLYSAAGGALFAVQQGTCFVPVMTGSPRYLVLKAVFPEQCCPPQQLLADGAECRLHYSFEAAPEMVPWQPLVPEHFLVSYHDVVPGLQRLDAATGLATPRFLGITSALREARLCSVHAVVLCALRLRLPDGFLEVVRKALLLGGGAPGSPGPSVHGGGSGYGGSPSRLALPLRELQQRLRVRASVHNGRAFVGPTVWARPASLEAVEGCRGEHCLSVGEDVALAWVPGDLLVAVVLELVLAPATADSEADSTVPGCTVLAWGALAPFSRVSGAGEAVVAEGPKQVLLRSGPGHWVRHAPVLDWRRLLERTNRISPDPPVAAFMLREAEGQGVWPPPAAPRALSLPRASSFRQRTESVLPVQLPSKQSSTAASALRHSRGPSVAQPLEAPASAHRRFSTMEAGASGSGSREAQGLAAEPSEAETLHTVREGGASREAGERKGKSAGQSSSSAGGYKAIARAETINLWQINAHWDQPPAQQQLQRGHSITDDGALPAPPPPAKTRLAPLQRTRGEEEALFAGSPTARYKGSLPAAAAAAPWPPAGQTAFRTAEAGGAESGDWWLPGSKCRAAVRWEDVAALAATATPISHSLSRHVSMGAELADSLDTDELTVQFVGYAPAHGVSLDALDSGSSRSRDAVLAAAPDGGGGALHFTFRLYTHQPTVTASVRPQLLPGGARGSGGGRLCALKPLGSPNEATAAAAGVSVTLPLHGPEQELEHQLGHLAAQGLAECRDSAVRQLHLRAARFLAERWLQVDVWDSTSLLQVGTFSVPLRGLLRQGQELAEVVHECPLHDQAAALQRECDPPTLASAPLRGTVFVRLLNRGRRGGLALGERAAPPSKPPLPAVVVRAKPALDEAGTIAHDLSVGLEVVASPSTLKEEIIQRAKHKVQRILHYRHVSTAGAGASAEAAPEEVGRLVHDQLLADIEQARDRCKPDIILRKLQQELPCGVVLCVGPGEAAAFEREFVNPSQEEGVFEVRCGASELALVTDAQEWQALSEAAAHAGLLTPAGGAAPRHVITSMRFKLGPRQRAILRFKWQGAAPASQPAAGVRMADLTISRAAQDGPSAGSAASAWELPQPSSPNLRFPAAHNFHLNQPGSGSCSSAVAPPLACFKVAVLPQPLLLDRTLRLYHAAGPGQATASQTVLLGQLPAAERLFCGNLRLVCEPGMAAAAVQGPSAHESSGVRLTYQAPPAGSSLCCALVAYGRASPCGAPLEAWEVYIHSLPCLEMTAVVGETVSVEKRLRAGAGAGADTGSGSGEGLQLSCHALCRDELQFSPCELDLRPGAEGRVVLSYTPTAPTRREALATIVDDTRQRPLEMLLVRLDATATRISRTFEVTVERGKVVSKKVSYTNPYQQTRAFALRTTQPGLLRFAQPQFQLGAGGSTQLRMTFDAGGVGGAAAAEGGRRGGGRTTQTALVFVDDVVGRRVEECFRVVLHIV